LEGLIQLPFVLSGSPGVARHFHVGGCAPKIHETAAAGTLVGRSWEIADLRMQIVKVLERMND
jgi:hypothetical protein